jgi:hypothetical protein
MYQLEIVTPLGAIMSAPMTESQIKEFTDNMLDSPVQPISMFTENGDTVFMTNSMLNQSVLFVKPFSGS